VYWTNVLFVRVWHRHAGDGVAAFQIVILDERQHSLGGSLGGRYLRSQPVGLPSRGWKVR
jgi:hypothetical protein